MPSTDRLKQLLDEVKHDLEQMDGWMTRQEPSPGVPYEEWLKTDDSTIDKGRNTVLHTEAG